MESVLLQTVQELGPIACIIVFFVWRDYKRELSMTTRLEQQDIFEREQLTQLVQQSLSVIRENTKALNHLGELPCLLFKNKNALKSVLMEMLKSDKELVEICNNGFPE